jgi:magnesium-transporting ATPase (P-type)
MKNGIKKLNTILFSVILCLTLTVTAFAEKEVKYSNELTVTPIRIFFAILVIILFVVMEIAFEKIREKRVEKRNKKYGKDKE